MRRIALAGPWLVLSAALVLAVAPAWKPVWYQDDQLPTLFRTYHTDLAHHYGVWYPRLAPELGFGYGRLLHQFYPPFGVELAAWLHTLGLGFVDAARATFSLCLVSSALGMYAYARRVLHGRWSAVLAALGFLWAPYVLLDAHKGGVLGESIAMAVMPWSLLALDRLVRDGGWRAFGATAGSLALVVLGHNITALFWIGLASLYALVLSVRMWQGWGALRQLAIAALAVLLALALSALYWLPALVELPYSRVSDQRTGEFTVTRYLVDPPDLLQPYAIFDYYIEAVPRFGLTAALLTVAAAVLVSFAAIRRPKSMDGVVARLRLRGTDRTVVLAFAACFVVVLLLQLQSSAVVWETVPLISFVQFPQRLFVFGSFAGALVLGAAPWAVRTLTGRARLALIAGVLVGGLLGASSLPGIYWTWPVSSSHIIGEEDMGIGTAGERRLSERQAFDDYFPSFVQENANQIPRPPTANRAEVYREASAGPVPHLEIVERGYLHLLARSTADEPATLILHQFYFPGWHAEASGAALEVGPAGPLGLVQVTVPAGEHVVRVWFGETPLRVAAIGVSAVALAVLLMVLTIGFGWRRIVLAGVLLAVAVVGPRLLHNRLDPETRPAVRAASAEVTETARVVGLELAETIARPGEVVPVTLLWQATAFTARDLQTGVRLVQADTGRVVSERWGRPNRERTPTGKWLVGEIVPDILFLRIPNDAPPGQYRLVAGLRDPDANRGSPLGLGDVGAFEIR